MDDIVKEEVQTPAVPAAKKLVHPLSVGNVFLGILLLLVLTFVAIYATAFIMSKSFDFVAVSKDMFGKLGMTDFFTKAGDWFRSWF